MYVSFLQPPPPLLRPLPSYTTSAVQLLNTRLHLTRSRNVARKHAECVIQHLAIGAIHPKQRSRYTAHRSGGRVKVLHLALATMRKPQSGFRSSEWNLMTQLDAGTHTAGLPSKPGPEMNDGRGSLNSQAERRVGLGSRL